MFRVEVFVARIFFVRDISVLAIAFVLGEEDASRTVALTVVTQVMHTVMNKKILLIPKLMFNDNKNKIFRARSISFITKKI